jgi:aspartate aminotransferase-like enzyme
MGNRSISIEQIVSNKNSKKLLFTAGPASLLPENLTGIVPCFGRGELDYLNIEDTVMGLLKTMTGKKDIIRMQGSASLALEIMSLSFLFGKVLIISTGFYSDRLKFLTECAKKNHNQIKNIDCIEWDQINKIQGSYDWVFSCSTETSCGLKIPIQQLHDLAKKVNGKLMLDATASIGLESDHYLADVLAFSSCKGLFGLTGAAFIAFDHKPNYEADSFYLNFSNHFNKMMTGPYHAISSLVDVLPRHEFYREAVVINKDKFLKKMDRFLTRHQINQPLLCTQVSTTICTDNKHAVLYYPRGNDSGSVVCHLGEAHLGANANADIINELYTK